MKLLNFSGLKEKRGNRSRSATYRDMKNLGFPLPIKIGGSIYWDEDAVDRWTQLQAEIPYIPKSVAVPKEGKRRGRKKNQGDVNHEN